MTEKKTADSPAGRRCACVAVDAYACLVARYHAHSWAGTDMDWLSQEPTERELVDDDGGPCECSCHYEDELDDDY